MPLLVQRVWPREGDAGQQGQPEAAASDTVQLDGENLRSSAASREFRDGESRDSESRDDESRN